jgi:hypothetical protein
LDDSNQRNEQRPPKCAPNLPHTLLRFSGVSFFMNTKQPNQKSTEETSAKRAARTEAFRRKNAERRSLRAKMRARLTVNQYREWRRQMRMLPFHSEKNRKDIVEGNSLTHVQSDRSFPRGPK